MILDSGLDNACTVPAHATNGFVPWVTWAAIGDGTAAPDPTDILLENQIGNRSNNNGGFDDLNDAATDAINNLIFVEHEFTRVFNITSNVTVREWGLAPANTGNLTARDLFRDLSNNPTAIPLEDGDQLQIVIKLRVQAEWEYEPASFVITGAPGHDSAGTHDGVATVSSGAAGTYTAILLTLRACWPAGPGGTGANLPATTVCMSSQSGVTKNQDLTGTRERAVQTAEAYTPGSFFVDWVATLTTSIGNGEQFAWVAGLNRNNETVGFRFLLTNPVSLTKTDSHRLVLTVRKHVARA